MIPPPPARIIGLTMALALTLPHTNRLRADTMVIDHAQSDYAVAIAPDASATVRQAAAELVEDLGTMTGAHLPLVTGRARQPAIYVGAGPHLPGGLAGAGLTALPEESFVLKIRNGDILLAGVGDRGTLYAVYTFLEKYAGARWYAPDATVLPHLDTLRIGRLDERETPGFAYRDTDEYLVAKSAAWGAHLKLNGVSLPAQGDLGGVNRLFNGAENFFGLVPPGTYFATHPEYFSLINGARSDKAQLCLTDPDVLRIVTDALIDEARRNPGELTLGLSPNDERNGNCQCDRCRASDARYGAASGTLLNFVNQVAAGVQAAFPERKIWVETLAYQYTQRAPTQGTIAPADNVLVCLAPIHACVFHPLAADPKNADSNAALLSWGAVAPGHLQVWHYVTNFANYLQPFPDWDELGADMGYYQAHGVSGMFCEGGYQSNGEFMAMRTWVIGHLLWDPHQDVWALVQDFCNGYYGAAGPDIYRYLRLYHELLPLPDMHMTIYDNTAAPYLKPDLLARANLLLDHAATAAETPQIKDRVEGVRLGLRYVALMQQRQAPIPDADKPAYRQRLDAFVNDLQHHGITQMAEDENRAAWIEGMEKLD